MLPQLQHTVEQVPVAAWAALLALLTLAFGYRIAALRGRTERRKPHGKTPAAASSASSA
ncbi:hypothetical protein [Streptomyces sp. Ac-502]|uniref:hypothetical protein n=1 Tax=Streptomyces sp. Ac-502 TaxID=3342801 RepID=UPI003862CDFE